MFLNIPCFDLSRDCLYCASLTITQALCNLDRLATVAILNGTNTITGYSSTNLRKKKLFKNATICWKPSSTPGIVAEVASLESTRLICRLELKSHRLKNGNQSIPANLVHRFMSEMMMPLILVCSPSPGRQASSKSPAQRHQNEILPYLWRGKLQRLSLTHFKYTPLEFFFPPRDKKSSTIMIEIG